jgi:hypothetical protein
LLAVVLIVALVSVALLGFFPGMASDAQKTQAKAYWASASPIAIVEIGPARYFASGHGNTTEIYLKLRNTGSHHVSITKVLGGDNYSAIIMTGQINIAPGEDGCFGIADGGSLGLCPNRGAWIQTPSTPSTNSPDILRGADTMCDTSNKGRLLIRNFGFEYTVTIDRQTLTKRQIGKALYADCLGGVS